MDRRVGKPAHVTRIVLSNLHVSRRCVLHHQCRRVVDVLVPCLYRTLCSACHTFVAAAQPHACLCAFASVHQHSRFALFHRVQALAMPFSVQSAATVPQDPALTAFSVQSFISIEVIIQSSHWSCIGPAQVVVQSPSVFCCRRDSVC